ncbi:MAG: flagellar hook capping FlgD N-terminal domain-containing protein [Ignavibacteriaceae bacterium]
MDLNSIANSGVVNTAASSTQSSSNGVLGKDDFLKLLITQLKNQDPLNPTDGTAFASQLAQFSSLEQLSNLNDAIQQSMNNSLYLTQSINNSLASNLVGKNVTVLSDSVSNTGQGETELGYTLSQNAKTASIEIQDEYGATVKTIQGVPLLAGDNKVSWDFSDNDGNELPEGKYTFKVNAYDDSGNSITTQTFSSGTIEGIKYSSSGAVVLINGVQYNLSDIMEILGNQ